jgi:hypothetical protein
MPPPIGSLSRLSRTLTLGHVIGTSIQSFEFPNHQLQPAGPNGFDLKIPALSAGTNKTIPVEGLDVDIPGLGSAGVVVNFVLDGNLQALKAEVGLDACIDIPIYGTKCGSSVISALPVWILNQTLSFTSVCPSAAK